MREPSAVYHSPYPRMTSTAGEQESLCEAQMEFGPTVFYCTRERAHDGRHEAGMRGGEMMVASWPRPTAEVTFSDGAKE